MLLQEINPFCETIDDHHLFSLLKQTAPNPPDVSLQFSSKYYKFNIINYEFTVVEVNNLCIYSANIIEECQ